MIASRFNPSMIGANPKTEAFFRVNLTVSIVGAATGPIDHSLRTSGLGAEIGGFRQGTVSAHAAAKEYLFDQMLTKSVEAPETMMLFCRLADFRCQGK